MKFLLRLFLLFIVVEVSGQTELKYNIDSVVVTTNRVPMLYAEIGRSLSTISESEIKYLPVSNFQDILEFSSGLDLKQRGPEGIQADLSIRGSSFEQTLILIDGIKLTDPQTGHHNMNIPISLSQIERVEILKGQGSKVYGANAFGGIVNIIPKYTMNNSLEIKIQGGENNYYSYGLSGSIKIGNSSHNIAFENSKSDGYRQNTEFTKRSISMNNSMNFQSAVIKTLFGMIDKNFGANSYYTVRFPDQAERTTTYLSALSADIELADFQIFPKLFWRSNSDEFVLDKNNHAFYKNNHQTNVYGGEIQISTNDLGGTSSFGMEYSLDDISSNNLGDHQRKKMGFFLEQNVRIMDNLNISLGGYAYNYSQLDWQFWPGIDAAYLLADYMKVFASYGKAFRVPTFTELYYRDPITVGNNNLKPEESDNYEIGFLFGNYNFSIESAYFRRDGKNLIDYIFDQNGGMWESKNLTKIVTQGFEVDIKINLQPYSMKAIKSLNIEYTNISSDKNKLYSDSRYVLEHLEHDLTIKLFSELPYQINNSLIFNFEDRVTLGDVFTVDTKFNKDIDKFNISLKISNIFNRIYEEIPGVTLPGRWLIAGLEFNIF